MHRTKSFFSFTFQGAKASTINIIAKVVNDDESMQLFAMQT
jgi:hypothetical protein